MGIQVDIAAASDQGRVRSENQDFHGSHIPDRGCAHPKGVLLALADGMGGHAGGQKASRIAVETLMEVYYKDLDRAIPACLERAVLRANTAVLAHAEAHPELRGMGSTLTAVVLQKNMACYAHVGDSRGYLVQDGTMAQFTRDHSLVADLVRAGVLTPEDAKSHPERNIITRAIGMGEALKVEVAPLAAVPRKGQLYLLCCDGLHGQVDEDTIQATLQKTDDLDQACRRLVDLANASGGPDNITVVLARVDKVGLLSTLFG